MHFLGSLGIDLWILVAQIINFLVLLWLLTKLVYKPLLKRMEADEAALRAAQEAELALAEKEKQLDVKQKRYETRIKNKARAIVDEAEEIAEEIKQSARQETAKEKAAVLEQINRRLNETHHE